VIDGLKPYPRMKDSGVEWLGEVPEHWEVLPNRALFTEVNERGHPDEQMLSVTITKGIIPQRSLLEESAKKDGSRLDRSAYKLVQPNDIAYNKMRDGRAQLAARHTEGLSAPRMSSSVRSRSPNRDTSSTCCGRRLLRRKRSAGHTASPRTCGACGLSTSE